MPPFLAAKVTGVGAAFLVVPSLTGAFIHWDAVHYLYIAAHGYPRETDFHDGFLPGYPLLIRVAQFVVSDPVRAALTVSAFGEYLALFWIARWLLLEHAAGASSRLWLYALWPVAVFLGLIYSEAPFIACAAACVYYARAGHLGRAVAWGAAACALRPFGLALVVLLLGEVVARQEWRPRRALLIAIVPLPLVAFVAALGLWTGDWLAYFHAQTGPTFGNHMSMPWEGIINAWHGTWKPSSDLRLFYALTLIGTLAGIGAVIYSWVRRDFPRSLAAYCTAALAMVLTIPFSRSTLRYELGLFPLMLLVPAPWRLRPWLVLCGGGSVLAAAHFAQGYWLG
ncbi:MAG: mannosyltransferase family protein [Candidatus Dormibacteraceae bacterium]